MKNLRELRKNLTKFRKSGPLLVNCLSCESLTDTLASINQSHYMPSSIGVCLHHLDTGLA